MLKLTVNRVRIDFDLEPATPLLIKSGDEGAILHPELPKLMFVRTGPREDETVYIPGSSLKGVVRSAAERVLLTVGMRCCDPLDQKTPCNDDARRQGDEIARNAKDARRRNGEHPMAPIYKAVCCGCRTFGSQAISSRVLFADAYPPKDQRERANATERRSGVAIDRKTGGPRGGQLFDMELVTGGAFRTSIHLGNVQLWQVALLGLVLRDLDEGFVRLGSAKSRGLGHMRVRLREAVLEQTDPARKLAAPAGLGVLRESLVEPYGLIAAKDDRLSDAAGGEQENSPLGRLWRWQGEAAWKLLDACAGVPWAAACSQGAAT